jgi:hypothetical protein
VRRERDSTTFQGDLLLVLPHFSCLPFAR